MDKKLLIGLIVVLAAALVLPNRDTATAQSLKPEPENATPDGGQPAKHEAKHLQHGRFQVSSYAYPANGGRNPELGCYIIDTVTGELWSSKFAGRPRKISGPLRD